MAHIQSGVELNGELLVRLLHSPICHCTINKGTPSLVVGVPYGILRLVPSWEALLLEAAGPQITIPGDTTEHTFGSLVQAVLTGTFKLPTPPPVHTKPAEEKKRTMQLHVSRITELIQYSGLHGGEVEDFVQKAAERHVENIIKFDKALLSEEFVVSVFSSDQTQYEGLRDMIIRGVAGQYVKYLISERNKLRTKHEFGFLGAMRTSKGFANNLRMLAGDIMAGGSMTDIEREPASGGFEQVYTDPWTGRAFRL